MTHNEMIAVIEAHRDGKRIEFHNKDWDDVTRWNFTDKPRWDFSVNDYRIAVEPRRCWVKWDLDGALIYRKYEEVHPDVSKEFGWQLVVEELR